MKETEVRLAFCAGRREFYHTRYAGEAIKLDAATFILSPEGDNALLSLTANYDEK